MDTSSATETSSITDSEPIADAKVRTATSSISENEPITDAEVIARNDYGTDEGSITGDGSAGEPAENPGTVTVIYAYREAEAPPETFPEQTLPPERMQVLTVFEDDPCHPRKNSLTRIAEATGDYIILLDEGDDFRPSFLADLLKLAKKNPEAALLMPCAVCKHIRRTPEYFYVPGIKGKNAQTMRPNSVSLTYPTELHGLLLPADEFREALSAARGKEECEKLILLDLLRKKPMFLCVTLRRLTYFQPRECDHQYGPHCYSHDWYYRPLEEFLLPLLKQEAEHPDEVALMSQYLALYMIQIRLVANRDNRNKHVLEPEEIDRYTNLLSEILQYVDTSVILNRTVHISSSPLEMQLLEMRLKHRDGTLYPALLNAEGKLLLIFGNQYFCSLGSIPLRVNLIDYRDGHLELDGEYFDFLSDDAEVFARFGKEEFALDYNRRYSLTKFFGQSFYRKKTFHLSIPVPNSSKERMLNFFVRYDGWTFRMEYGFPSHTSRYTRDLTYNCWNFGNYISFWNKKGIHVRPASKKVILRKQVLLWLQMWKSKKKVFREQLPLKILNFLLRPWLARQHIWLFFDKIYKGGDSSEYLYRYACTQNDGIRKYYLLDKSSADYARMRREGYRPLVRGSLMHRLAFLNADLVIASNSTVFAFNDYDASRSVTVRGDTHFGVACVQHGMSVQKIAIAQQRLRDNTKLYFCASKYEIKNLSHPAYDYMGYDALKLTGVPRYDGLKSRAEKILLFSPTWRMNSALPVTKNEGVARDYNPHFKETEYYKVYNGLMNDPRLLDAARQHGYRIQYVLHPIVSPQADDFTKNDLVEIIPSIGDMSYEKLFCEAALMVTDFSGVQFDFAYMRKPVVYLHHHDIPQHYEEGTFFYETMGFGEICRTNEELIDVLCRYMENNCEMPEMYRKRADDFFEFSDHENCARIYPIMLEYQKDHFGI